RQALLMQVDMMGNPIWVRSYLLTTNSITADGLILPPNGNICFSGRMFSATGAASTTIVADVLAANGAVVWSRRIDDFLNGFAAVANDNDRFALVGGTSISRASAGIYKFDPAGVFAGAMMYGQPNQPGEGQDVVALPCNKGYALTGQTTMLPSNGPTDVHLVRTNINLQSGCREAPLPNPVPIQLGMIQRQLNATFRQEFVPWQTFNQRRVSGNIL